MFPRSTAEVLLFFLTIDLSVLCMRGSMFLYFGYFLFVLVFLMIFEGFFFVLGSIRKPMGVQNCFKFDYKLIDCLDSSQNSIGLGWGVVGGGGGVGMVYLMILLQFVVVCRQFVAIQLISFWEFKFNS